MNINVQSVESEFELMVKYQVAIESKCSIVRNAPNDKFPYSLHTVKKPFPSYIEYKNGNDFEEDVLIKEGSLKEMLVLQNERRNPVLSLSIA